MKLIVASKKDPAASNVTERLFDLYDFEKVSEKPGLYKCGDIALAKIPGDATQLREPPFGADEVIVASKHVSETGNPSLTAHVPGDPSKRELAVAAPPTLGAALAELFAARDELGLSYDVSFEATHHGPTGLDVPVTFVEIGSATREWRDPKAGEAVARAIMKAARSPAEGINAVGFGGTHYARRHTEVILRTEVRVGHVFPRYTQLDEGLARAAIERTRGGAGVFALDWKGLKGEQRALMMKIGENLGVQVLRERDILSGKAFNIN